MLTNLFPELVPTPIGLHDFLLAENRLQPLLLPAYARAPEALFDKGLAGRLSHTRAEVSKNGIFPGQVLCPISGPPNIRSTCPFSLGLGPNREV